MKKLLLLGCFLFNVLLIIAQGNVGIGTQNPSALAALEISSSDNGILIPRVEKIDVEQAAGALDIPNGLLIYQPSDNTFYYYNIDQWIAIGSKTVLEDTDGDTKIQVEEGFDDDVIRMDLSGDESLVLKKNPAGNFILEMKDMGLNTVLGQLVFPDNLTGGSNVAIGVFNMFKNTSGSQNIAIGNNVLQNNISGSNNVAIGQASQIFNEGGNENTAIGGASLAANKVGIRNTAVGYQSLNSAKGEGNTAIGYSAGSMNAGEKSVFIGHLAGSNQQGNEKLVIENSSADSSEALIYGEFDNDLLRFNAETKIYSNSNDETGLFVTKTQAGDSNIPAILGHNRISPFYGIGVQGEGNSIGVYGSGFGSLSGEYIGTYGEAIQTNAGTNYGIRGYAVGGATNYAVFGNTDSNVNSYAGYFEGKVNIKAAASDAFFFQVENNSGDSKISVSEDEVLIKDLKVIGNSNAVMKYYIALTGSSPTSSGPASDVVGRIVLYPSTNNAGVSGWQECDGSLLLIADYTLLHSIIGTTYGGDGTLTFGVPDLRNTVPVYNP